MSQSNPWVKDPKDVASLPPVDQAETSVLPRVARPQPGAVALPDAVDRLALRRVEKSAAAWVVGCHGGAGESTLARVLEVRGTERSWPLGPDPVAPERALLVARTNAHGLERAQRALQQWAGGDAGDTRLLGLLLIQDAPGRLPRPLREYADMVAGGSPRVWHMPWVEALRLEPLDVAAARKGLGKVLQELRAVIDQMGEKSA